MQKQSPISCLVLWESNSENSGCSVRPIAVAGVGTRIPDAMGAISTVGKAFWVVTHGGPNPEYPVVRAREPQKRQMWNGVLRHAGSCLRLRQNVGHDARGETCLLGERERVGGSTCQARSHGVSLLSVQFSWEKGGGWRDHPRAAMAIYSTDAVYDILKTPDSDGRN